MPQARELDMENRDPNNLNDHIKVNFEDLFGEPEGVRSPDCVWRNAYNCFECGKNCCYQLMTLLCGICIALVWGCEFAMLAYNHVWTWTPYMRYVAISFGCYTKFMKVILDCCCAPFCEAWGSCFSRIRITKG